MQNISIEGLGNFAGGEYGSIYVDGTVSCPDDITCESISVDGTFRCGGSIRAVHADADGTVTIDGALNITGALTMGDKLSALLAEMSSWETSELVLFTGVSSFNGDAVATEAELASNYFTGASGNMYVEYRVDDTNNVGSIVIINRMDAVPEPASATLSLAALMMLCARRRRRA